jgi:hypothetical protein
MGRRSPLNTMSIGAHRQRPDRPGTSICPIEQPATWETRPPPPPADVTAGVQESVRICGVGRSDATNPNRNALLRAINIPDILMLPRIRPPAVCTAAWTASWGPPPRHARRQPRQIGKEDAAYVLGPQQRRYRHAQARAPTAGDPSATDCDNDQLHRRRGILPHLGNRHPKRVSRVGRCIRDTRRPKHLAIQHLAVLVADRGPNAGLVASSWSLTISPTTGWRQVIVSMKLDPENRIYINYIRPMISQKVPKPPFSGRVTLGSAVRQTGERRTMSTYEVMPRVRQPGYKVEVITSAGTRHTILGFDTEAEAAGWAKADKERDRFQSTDAD